MNMLIAEYDYDTDIAVQREEERETALQEGAYQKALETAQTMKSMQYPIADIHKITGLSIAEINDL